MKIERMLVRAAVAATALFALVCGVAITAPSGVGLSEAEAQTQPITPPDVQPYTDNGSDATDDYSEKTWYWVNPHPKQDGLHYQCVDIASQDLPLRDMRRQFANDIKLVKDAYEDRAHVAVFEHAGQRYYYTDSIYHCTDMLEEGELKDVPRNPLPLPRSLMNDADGKPLVAEMVEHNEQWYYVNFDTNAKTPEQECLPLLAGQLPMEFAEQNFGAGTVKKLMGVFIEKDDPYLEIVAHGKNRYAYSTSIPGCLDARASIIKNGLTTP